jgi:transcriptional regulator with XRE-family HTH domain
MRISGIVAPRFSPEQRRSARGLLGRSQSELSEASRTAAKTIADFERGTRRPRTLEKASVEFIAENGGGAGVKTRKKIRVHRQTKTRTSHRTKLWEQFSSIGMSGGSDIRSSWQIGPVDP